MGNAMQKNNLETYNDSLLFQFVLSEFIPTLKEIQAIKRLYKGLGENPTICSLNGQEIIAPLVRHLSLLVGPETGCQHNFPWMVNTGSLTKLHYYSSLLGHSMESHNKDTTQFFTSIIKAYHSSLECKEMLLSLEHKKMQCRHISAPLHNALEQLIDTFCQASKLLSHIVVDSFHDENICFFLLKHMDELNQLYRGNFVTKILSKIYPEGIDAAEKFLVKEYSKRGFNNMLPALSHRIALVKAAC